MLKLGICTPNEDTPYNRLWRRGLMAASLLPATGGVPTPSETDRFERLMRQICLSNGVARTTRRGRFHQLNQEVQRYLCQAFSPGTRLCVEDWAISNGITAAEWYMHLRQDFPELHFTGSDRTSYLVEAELIDGSGTYILEPDGTPIQYVRPPFVVSLVQPHHWVYPVNSRIQRHALRQWKKVAARLHLPREWNGIEGANNRVSVGPFVLRRLPLIHPEVSPLCGEQFRIRHHSIFDPLPAPVDVVRTMNILNRAYFPDAMLRQAAAAVAASLRPGGIWIVGRTIAEDQPQHEVTVCRLMDAGTWEVLARTGGGSEIEPLLNC